MRGVGRPQNPKKKESTMTAMAASTNAATVPNCDVCIRPTPAYADARLSPIGSAWGYVCKKHFDLYGCTLGTGHGQLLDVA